MLSSPVSLVEVILGPSRQIWCRLQQVSCVQLHRQQVHVPSSNDTSSMSDVTEILCAVSKGDLAGGASSVDVSVTSIAPLVCSASSLACMGTSGTSDVGEPALESSAVVSVDSRLLRSDRDRDCERSVCNSGRGVISDASSKLSCNDAFVLVCGLLQCVCCL